MPPTSIHLRAPFKFVQPSGELPVAMASKSCNNEPIEPFALLTPPATPSRDDIAALLFVLRRVLVFDESTYVFLILATVQYDIVYNGDGRFSDPPEFLNTFLNLKPQ